MEFHLPIECIECIVESVPPKQRFRIATDLRLGFIQKQCLLVLPFARVVYASAKGQCDLLDVLWNNNDTLICAIKDSVKAIHMANQYGHVAVLEWWKNRTARAGSFASSESAKALFGNLLEKRQGIRYAIDRGHIHILAWWKEVDPFVFDSSNYYDSLSDYAMETASLHGYVFILDWWKKCGFYCAAWRYETRALWSERAIVFATRHGRIPVLQWWKDNFEREFTPWTGLSPFRNFRHNTLSDEESRLVKQWWKENCGIDEGYEVTSEDEGYEVTSEDEEWEQEHE